MNIDMISDMITKTFCTENEHNIYLKIGNKCFLVNICAMMSLCVYLWFEKISLFATLLPTL